MEALMLRYSAKQRKLRHHSKQSRFILLPWVVKRSKAYQGLSPLARAALIEILDRYDGQNNGRIGLGVRELAYELNCSPATASRALRELDDSGLIQPRTVGAWRGGRATEWRIAFHRCDETGDLPQTQWEQRQRYSEFHQRNSKVSPVKNREAPSFIRETNGAKNAMNDFSPSFTNETHVPIYHEEGETEG
jgi:DNA-binding MarR family transcriptional regulator